MDAESVNAVIDNISNKLGIVANGVNDLVPEFIKLGISSSVVGIIFEIITLILLSFVAVKMFSRIENVDEFDDDIFEWITMITSIVFIIVFAFALIFDVNDLVGWIISPNAKAIEYVLGLIGNT